MGIASHIIAILALAIVCFGAGYIWRAISSPASATQSKT